MNIIRLTEEHKEQYEQFVAAHPSGSFLQSWSWGEFQITQGKQVVRYGVFDDARGLVAAVQFLDTKVPHLPGHYLYAPYGPLILEEFDEAAQSDIAHKLIGQVKSDFPNVWFIRIEPKTEVAIDGKPSVHIQPGSTLITDLTQSEEELLANMHNKTRYNIKVANKHNVTVESSEVAHEDALHLLEQTSERQKYKAYTSVYYKKLIEFFAGRDSDSKVKLYEAKHEEKTIASAIMIDHGNTRTYLFGGSDDAKRNVMAPYAMHWQAMRDAKNSGLKNYDWWGTETSTGKSAGFVQFKMRWGGTQKFYTNARDVILSSRWYMAYTALRKVNRFF